MSENRWGLNKSQRMQLKALICFLGILLALILLSFKLVLLLIHNRENQIGKEHIPVVKKLVNVWIAEVEADGLLVFQDGELKRYPYGPAQEPDGAAREQVADVVLTDGAVTAVKPKTDKINARVLSADSAGIELEGFGRLALAPDYKGYRLYDSLEMCTVRDLYFGYAFADFCLDEEGRVCGVLMVREEAMEYIRVLIKNTDFASVLHEQPVLTCDTDFSVVYGSYDQLQELHFRAGEELAVDENSELFLSDRIRVIPDVLTGRVILKNFGRNQGEPAYRGQMELLRTGGGVAVINEVLLEEYLYSVVPSEMPAKYPIEALKAQAVCARTYAYAHMLHAGYPQYGAHVDDSTAYQVYNNIAEQESTTRAVRETYGQILYRQDGILAGTYYYSTSCGAGSDANVWKTEEAPTLTYLQARPINRVAMEQVMAAVSDNSGTPEFDSFGELMKEEDIFRAFISGKNDTDFEAREPWYRWSYQVKELDRERMLEQLSKRYDANPKLVLTYDEEAEEYISCEPDGLDEITDIYVEKRGSGGVADELVIETRTRKYKVVSEHNIRYVLCGGEEKAVRQDGSRASCPTLLPSGFFVIDVGREGENVIGYTLTGGGFGHGVGMSQTCAGKMAGSGYAAGDILRFFYDECRLVNIYDTQGETG